MGFLPENRDRLLPIGIKIRINGSIARNWEATGLNIVNE